MRWKMVHVLHNLIVAAIQKLILAMPLQRVATYMYMYMCIYKTWWRQALTWVKADDILVVGITIYIMEEVFQLQFYDAHGLEFTKFICIYAI